MATTQAQIDKRSCGDIASAERVRGGRSFVPRVDILELPTALLLKADMPGVRQEDLDITYEDGELTLHGKVHPNRPSANTRVVLAEYEVGDWYRSFHIGEGIDALRIAAELRDGVLTVRLPKQAEHTRRKIEVKAG